MGTAAIVAVLVVVPVFVCLARKAFLQPEGREATWKTFERDAAPGDVLVTKSYDVGALISSMWQAGYFSHASAVVKDPDGKKWVLDASPFRSRRRFSMQDVRDGLVGVEIYWLRAREPAQQAGRASQKLEDLSDCKRTPWNFFNGTTCSAWLHHLNEIGVLPSKQQALPWTLSNIATSL